MSDIATLYGRDRELARLDLAIGSGTDGARFVRVLGVAGIGKTTTVATASNIAVDRGFRAIAIRGRAGSLGTPLAALAEGFDAVSSHLAARSDAHQAIDLDAAAAIVRQELATRADRAPHLLVLDDAHALDASSVAVLRAVLTTDIDEVDVSVVLVEQTDAPRRAAGYDELVEALTAEHSVLCVELEALDAGCITRIAQDALRLDTGDDVPAVIVERAGGNPWFAQELAAAWQRDDHEVPRNIAASAVSRLRAMPSAPGEFVQLCAISPDGVRAPWLESLSATAQASIDDMLASGLISVDGDAYFVAHPLMRAAIAEDMSIALRRVLHRELAAAIGDPTNTTDPVALRAIGFHLAAGGRPVDAVATYRAAAEHNAANGLPHEAHVDLCEALVCETRIGARIELLRACARAATYLGARDAVAHWTELGRLGASTHDDELYAYALVQQYWASNDGITVERLRRAANLGAGRTGWAARAAATLARLDGRLQDAIDHDTVAIRIGRQLGDAELEVLALEKLASSHALLGNTHDAIGTCRTAIERAISERFHDSAILTWGCLIETLTEELAHEEALAEARAADAYVTELGLLHKRPTLLAWQTSVLVRMGDLAAALRIASEAVELDRSFQSDPSYRTEHFGALVALLRADVANEVGDANALELVQLAAAKVEELGYHSWQLEVDFERARAIARRDGVDAALPYIATVEASGEPAFVASVTRWLVRAGAMGGSTAALDRVRALRAVDYAWGDAPLLDLTRAEVDVTLMCVDTGHDIEALHRVAADWRTAGRVLDALRVEQVAGAILIERGDIAAARYTLRSAFTELSRRSATGDVDQVAALLRRTGTRTRAAIRQTSVGTLTQRELEIARLAAGGAKNREIANSLFITENTVTAHMTNVYDKTGLASRVRLAQWLREHDAADVPVAAFAAI